MATLKILFTQTEIETSFDKLVKKETCPHKEVISRLKEIGPNSQKTTSVEPLIQEIRKFCARAIPTIYEAWEKASKYEPLAGRFDLQDFLPKP